MQSVFSLIKLENRSTIHHPPTESHKLHQEILDIEQSRLSSLINQGHIIEIEISLKLGELEKLHQNRIWIYPFFEINRNSDLVFIGFITDIVNPLNLLVYHKLSDLGNEIGFIYKIRNLIYNNHMGSIIDFIVSLPTNNDSAFSLFVDFSDIIAIKDHSSRWEVRSFDDFHNLFNRNRNRSFDLSTIFISHDLLFPFLLKQK